MFRNTRTFTKLLNLRTIQINNNVLVNKKYVFKNDLKNIKKAIKRLKER